MLTGSARLDTYKKGGDSLAGRFFAYRLHPLTVKEICGFLDETPKQALDALIRFGGFPEPYLRKNETYSRRWRKTLVDTVIREDLLDLEKVRDVKSIEILIDLLRSRVGSTTSYSSLAEDLQVSIHTVKHWLQILENLCVVFAVRPYHRNIARSLLKEAKYYFYDTGGVEGDAGTRLENIVALALLRELHLLEDTQGSKGELHYLRDKDKMKWTSLRSLTECLRCWSRSRPLTIILQNPSTDFIAIFPAPRPSRWFMTCARPNRHPASQ